MLQIGADEGDDVVGCAGRIIGELACDASFAAVFLPNAVDDELAAFLIKTQDRAGFGGPGEDATNQAAEQVAEEGADDRTNNGNGDCGDRKSTRLNSSH